ncbi:TPA: hypothetical protein N0F65_012998 [Lagenidium giganteum]|uniref:Uncharacterized protein n=1 Tax=Lagenidium giganteum TaxID=4803 RepID=A0AAV2YDH4_9STRA|nr:TPA: hypothetical protein N0F65_012998 [Lagenidium giganteum]
MVGKKRKQGASAGKPAKRPTHDGGLVVVNPMLLQSVNAKSQASATSAASSTNKSSTKTKTNNQSDKQTSKRDDKTIKRKSGATGNAPVVKKTKATDTAKPKAKAAVAGVGAHDFLELGIDREEHGLAAMYWGLLSRPVHRKCVVAIPNQYAPTTAPALGMALKNLGFSALSVHSKMPPAQKKQHIQRFQESEQPSGGALPSVLVVTEHTLSAVNVPDADVLLLQVEPKPMYTKKFASAFLVRPTKAVAIGDVSNAYPVALSRPTLQQLQSRLKVATQIAELTQKLASSSTTDSDSKWAAKLAKGADLEDDEDEGAQQKQAKKKMTPDEQRVDALTKKLTLLLARKIDVGNHPQQSTTSAQPAASLQDGKEKLEVLGVTIMNAAVGASMSDERLSAQTQWMDQAPGRDHGGDWDGVVRHGASKDAVSLKLREQYVAESSGKEDTALKAWKPNKSPMDIAKWGGAFGKPCGHNEVVMQRVRPFFPQEVLNSRVCSKAHPAPGNHGFDGCLEFLRLQCQHHQRVMTIWDAEHFMFLTKSGSVQLVKKTALLHLGLPTLQCLMTNLRVWTLASNGQVPLNGLLAALRLCSALGGGDKRSPSLEMKLMKRIMSFALAGSVRQWRHVAALALPLPVDTLE